MSSWRIKVGNDPTVEEWLKAQKSKSGSVQFLIKIFAHLHGNSDITKMSFNELFETGDVRSQRYRVTDAVKVGAIASTATKQMYEPKANTGETKVRTIVNTPQIGESKVSVPMEKVVAATSLPVEKKSQEQREPSQKEKKKDNMLLSML